jgi:hypothetical protein
MSKDVIVVIGAGKIGVAIARRQGFGKTLPLADFNDKILAAVAAIWATQATPLRPTA